MSVSRHNTFFPFTLNCRPLLICLLVLILTSASVTQTKWFKYEGNPILDLGPAGAWDDDWIHIDRVILKDSLYRMWYSGGWKKARIGYATSRDGVTWKKDKSNPVLDIRPGSWESSVHRGYVIISGSKYHMWYTGDEHGHSRFGYASSKDGIVWKKHSGNPILDVGPPESWDELTSGLASVVGPDTSGAFKMWYQGNPGFKIGFATATDETSWTKYPDNPIFSDDDIVYYPRVTYEGGVYEMWYGVRPQPGVIRYSTSPDGLHWTRSPDISVLSPGPNGSWDDEGLTSGDVLSDGNIYHMWYNGDDGSGKWRGGYAVSPKGLNIAVSSSNAYISPGSGQVRVVATLSDPSGLRFSARIREAGEEYPESQIGLLSSRQVAEMELFDDGSHGDGTADDEVFANNWVPTEERIYFLDLGLKLHRNDTLRFEMSKAAVFTTIGPVAFESLRFVGDSIAHPGDTVLVKLLLRNRGSSTPARSVTATLSSTDPSITSIAELSPGYGNIAPGAAAATVGYYRLHVNPYSPLRTDATINVTISSWGIPLWYDTFTLRVTPPWWRTTWAYVAYVLAGALVILRMRRFERNRQQLKYQVALEHVESEKLREVDRMKSRFFANVSHEFRTPLTLILGPLQKMMTSTSNDEEKRVVHLMHSNARRMLRLINQLLDISKLEAGMMKLEATRGNIVSFAWRITHSFQSVAASKDISLITVSDAERIELYFDTDKMEKILSNLLSNAFKFTPERGKVEVSVRVTLSPTLPISGPTGEQSVGGAREGGQGIVDIAISDTGIGIPEEELSHIFDRFYQVDGSEPRKQEGTGIGLALVKELVDVHHGTISVRSAIGKGTKFTIQFPLGSAHLKASEIARRTYEEDSTTTEAEASVIPEAAVKPPEERAESIEHGALILVVEDNADVRSYIREQLDPTYRVLESHDGNEGIKTAIETIPDLIISDVMMQEKDGYELCRILKRDEKTSHIPIILLTAKAGTESKIEGLELGADDYLVKPFEVKELLVRVKNLVDQRKKLREKFQRELIVQPKDVKVKSIDEIFLIKALAVIESHVPDPSFNTASLADELAMSRMQLHRKLRALTNSGPGELIRSFRMRRAASLILQKVGNISEIAYEVGYTNPSNFAQVFKEFFGVPPSEYVLRQESQKH